MISLFGKHKKALVIGAGSGRDMATAVIITEKLRTNGIKVDLAGFLTPWAVHTFNNRLEKPINILTKNSKKFLAIDLKKPLTSYFEPKLIDLNKKLELEINKFYLFSLHYGTNKLKEAIQKLIRKNGYDFIIAVDVGGDCLAHKQDYKSIFTPIVDLSCISILSKINFKGDIILSVIAPGTDGEIKTFRIKKIISDLKKKNLILRYEQIYCKNTGIKKFLKLNNEINNGTSSTSGTFRIIKKYLEPNSPDKVKEIYTKQLFVNGKKFEFKFNQIIENALATGIFYLDLKKFSKFSKHRMKYNSIIDAQEKYRKSYGGTEVDLSYIPIIRDSKISKVIYSVTPMNRIKGDLRKKIIQEGLNLCNNKKIGYIKIKS